MRHFLIRVRADSRADSPRVRNEGELENQGSARVRNEGEMENQESARARNELELEN